MKIDITYISKGSSKSRSVNPESELFIKTLDKSLIDYNPGDVIPGYSTQPVSMVIITDTAFRKQLAALFQMENSERL